jgi:hypothetical protein
MTNADKINCFKQRCSSSNIGWLDDLSNNSPCYKNDVETVGIASIITVTCKEGHEIFISPSRVD